MDTPLIVTIEVKGGVAYVTDKPKGIIVKIFDRDCEDEEQEYDADDIITDASA